MLSTRQLFFRHLAPTSYKPVALEIDQAKGCWLYSPSKNKYLDLISGISVSNIGHNNTEVIEAVKMQAERHMHLMVYGELIQAPQVLLADTLCNLLPGNLNSVYYTGSGSESVEGALKLARRHTGRHEIIAFRNAYHGSTMGALTVTGNEEYKRAFRPLVPSVTHLDFNCPDSLDMITNKTACVIVEPVQGEAGIILPVNNFLDKLRERCNENGTLLIFDEIQTGFGRTGQLFALEKYNVAPDIVLFAKGFGGGMPLGAFVSSKDIMKSFCSKPDLGHITTFGGHPVSCAAALASLNYIVNNDLCVNVLQAGTLFKEMLNHDRILEVRGDGLLLAIEFENENQVKKVVDKCILNGVLTDWFLFNDRSIRVCPPLIISRQEIEFACSVLLDAIDDL